MYGENFDERMAEVCEKHHGDNLLSIFYGGTAAAGDTIRGWSDFDVVFVVKNLDQGVREKAGAIGRELNVGDPFKIHYLTKDQLMNYGPVWLLLDKYHAEWVYGENLKKEIEAPTDEKLEERLLELNDKFRGEFLKYEQNFPFWSNERRKEKLYYILKRMIHPVYCTHHYLDSGDFKGGREELKKTGNENAKHIIETLQNWKNHSVENWEKEKDAVLKLSNHIESKHS